MRLLVLAAALGLAGCRLEPAPPASGDAAADSTGAACDCADGRDVAQAPPEAGVPGAYSPGADGPEPPPPSAAGDTARVGRDQAGAFDAPLELRPNVSAAGLAIPVAGVEADDLVDTFQAARSEGRTHNAIDILAPRGTPVVAASAGTVARLFTSDKGGLTVYVLADDRRTVAYYAHLDAYAPGLRTGQRVRRGQPVGTVGDSGNAVPGNTHLHFALWTTADPADFWDGEPVNPYPLLARPR